jgi:hypothetical protein
MVKFPFEFIILKMFIAETYPFRENFLGNENFRENLLIFAFRENGKNRFRFNPSWASRKKDTVDMLRKTNCVQILRRGKNHTIFLPQNSSFADGKL